MKNNLFIIVLLTAFCHPVRTIAQVLNLDDGATTRAVVIGISDYADERIPDLQFAHRDAEAFAAWLQSPAGGLLPEEQIKLLTNDQAKLGNIVAAIDWLMAESKKGDRVLIYFSGHGDVEKLTKFNRGYLLAYDAPGTSYMAGGALNLLSLQDIISTLSDAEVQVVMISDACRAGKLAGSETGGTQQTTTELSRQYAHEIKILSCEPDEYSLEGEQWGGGRGCFSYYLLNGLTGLADGDKNHTVDLREIGRYLQDKVSEQVSPSRQSPMVVGSTYAPIAQVDEATLTELRKLEQDQMATIQPIKSKGMEDLLLAGADSTVQQLYDAFTAALARGELMSPIGASANDYFERLMQRPGIEKLQGVAKRNFAAALQNEAQLVVNKLLRTDPQIIDEAFPGRVRYAHLPAYLARAAEILGEQHYMYRYLKCKQYFFEAKTFTKEKYPDLSPDSLLKLSIQALDKALEYDSDAAYVHFEKGLSYYWKVNQYATSKEYFQKAVELSPNWVLAVYYYGRVLSEHGWAKGIPYDEGISYLKEALKFDSTFLPTYERLGFFEIQEGSKYWQTLYVQKMERLIAEKPESVPANYYKYLGWTLMYLGRFSEMEQVALKFGQMTNYEDPVYWKLLGLCYLCLGRYEDALGCFEKFVRLKPYDGEGYNNLALTYLELNQPVKAEETCKSWIQAVAGDTFSLCYAYRMLGDSYLTQGRRAEAEPLFQKIMEYYPNSLNPMTMNSVGRAQYVLHGLEAMERTIHLCIQTYPDNGVAYYQAACLYALAGKEMEAMEWLERALIKGSSVSWGMLSDYELHSIRDTPEFKALVKKYLPEFYRD